MFYNNFSPEIASLGSLEIRWYGAMYLIAFIIAYFMIYHLAKQRKLKLEKEDVADFIVYSIAGLIIGARVFYILFYNPAYYFSNPSEIIAVWHGGLSFHGGLAGIMIVGYFFCKKKKLSYLDMADIVVLPSAIGMFFGRIGNFINGELYGRITNVPWAVKFAGVDGLRHPSQLYEAFYNIVIFSILWIIKDKKLPKGALFFSMIAMYGLFRFITEFFRQPDEQIGFLISGLTMGQLLTLPMFLIGAGALVYLYRKEYK